MKSISILAIALVLVLHQAVAIYPPPRSVLLTEEYLHIPNVCGLYQIFSDKVN